MRLIASVCLFVAACTVATVPAAGQAEDAFAKGAAILAGARKVLGGDEKLTAVNRFEARGTVRRAAGDVTIDGDLEISVELPDKYLRKESVTLGGAGQGFDRSEGLNGNDAWEEMKFGGGVSFGDDGGFRGGRQGGQQDRPAADGRGAQRDADPERLKEQQLRARQTEVARVLLATLLSSNVPVRWIGSAVSPQATAEVLEMQTPDGTPVRLLIDSKTYMPLMLTWTGAAQDPIAALAARAGFGRGRGGRGRGGFGFPGGGRAGGGERRGGAPPDANATETRADALAQATTLRMFLSEYKEVNGIKLPHLMVRGTGDQVTEEWVIRNYRINPNFKADTFSR